MPFEGSVISCRNLRSLGRAFVDSPDNPLPPMSNSVPGSRPERRLRYALALEAEVGPSRGTVILLQGRKRGEREGFRAMRDLNASAFASRPSNWRGQGRSFRSTRSPTVGHVTHVGITPTISCAYSRKSCWRAARPYAILLIPWAGWWRLAAMERAGAARGTHGATRALCRSCPARHSRRG